MWREVTVCINTSNIDGGAGGINRKLRTEDLRSLDVVSLKCGLLQLLAKVGSKVRDTSADVCV